MHMAIVKLERVQKTYENGHCAVADASFDIRDKELLVLVGPSGCGKSTLLRVIAGLETISSGTISIDGKIVNQVDAKDRDIAMVFQSYALYPHMTVADNLRFSLQLRKLPTSEVEERVTATAAMLGLQDLMLRRPAQLSGGQRQRVALGRALVRKPSVFLLDEPLSNLDAKLRMSMRIEIARLHRQLEATMIYVTHDQIEAMTLGQRIVVFHGGHIQQIDTPMQLYAKPCNVFVAGFLGSPAMNFFHGQLRRDGLGAVLDMGAAQLPMHGFPILEGAMAAWLQRGIIVGIRPEDLLLSHQRQADKTYMSVEADLEVVEAVGNEVFLNLRFSDQDLVARMPPDRMPTGGNRIALHYAFDKLHFFDADGASPRIAI
jgi:multiple sugar transport system ATP-binding protein